MCFLFAKFAPLRQKEIPPEVHKVFYVGKKHAKVAILKEKNYAIRQCHTLMDKKCNCRVPHSPDSTLFLRRIPLVGNSHPNKEKIPSFVKMLNMSSFSNPCHCKSTAMFSFFFISVWTLLLAHSPYVLQKQLGDAQFSTHYLPLNGF